MRKLILIIVLLFTSAAIAQQQPALERVLVPVWTVTPVAGAFGSLWRTEIVIVNRSDQPVAIYG